LRSIPQDDLDSGGKGLGWKIFLQGLGFLKEVSVVFPPMQAAVAGLFRVLEKIEVKALDAVCEA
jgi:hypothetical protein